MHSTKSFKSVILKVKKLFTPSELSQEGSWSDLFIIKKILVKNHGKFNGQIKFFNHHLTHQKYGETIANENTLIKIEEILKDGSTCIAPYNPDSLNDRITKDGKIGFRIPNHDYLKAVLNEYQKPITTTSINKSGSEPLYSPDDIEEQFGDKIDLLIDDGEIKNSPSKIFVLEKDKIKRIR